MHIDDQFISAPETEAYNSRPSYSRGKNAKPLINPKHIKYNNNQKPLSANRKDRNSHSKMEYGDSDTYNGGFAKFGNDTQEINMQKLRKRDGKSFRRIA